MSAGRLTVNPDTPEAYTVELTDGEVLQVGRKPSTGGIKKLVLPYPEVSGQHAEIRCKPGGWTVVDSGSTNGTTLDSARLTPGREYLLRSGGRIRIAQYELAVYPPEHAVSLEEESDDSQDRTQFRIQMMNATILVGDIKGFTSLMEENANQPALVMQAAQKVFDELNVEINRNYGQLEKIAGDAIMAYWHGAEAGGTGASVPVCQACYTALQLKTLTRRLAGDPTIWPFTHHPLMLDMALATGPVAAGSLGSLSNPALLGDTANLVFRLEKLIGDDRPGDIFVEGQTYELAKEHFRFEFLGQHKVKGRERVVDVYQLTGQIT
jgi:class 3 adenylate cyclase